MADNRYYGPLIQLADLDGSNVVEFVDANAPYPIPRPSSPYQAEFSIMRPGLSDDPDSDENLSAGLRTVQLIGTHVSHRDVDLQIAWILPDQVALCQAKFDRLPPQPMKLTLDGGVTWYRVVWRADRSWDPKNWEANWRDQSGTIQLAIMGVMPAEE